LLEAAGKLSHERRRREAQRAAKEKARREREQVRERARYLAQLGRRQAAAWREVEALISKRNPNGYDDAVALLADLREVASTRNRTAEFEARVTGIRERHARKTAFIGRLDRLETARPTGRR
jgi:hypothetical protein